IPSLPPRRGAGSRVSSPTHWARPSRNRSAVTLDAGGRAPPDVRGTADGHARTPLGEALAPYRTVRPGRRRPGAGGPDVPRLRRPAPAPEALRGRGGARRLSRLHGRFLHAARLEPEGRLALRVRGSGVPRGQAGRRRAGGPLGRAAARR